MFSTTFLTDEQIFGDSKLEIFKKIGSKAAVTDFSILLGAYVSDNYYTDEGEELKYRTGWYWTKTQSTTNNARAVSTYGNRYILFCTKRTRGSRPALTFSTNPSIPRTTVRDLEEIEFGEYPQTVASKSISNALEREYSSGRLTKTGKSYTTDSVKYDDYNTEFNGIKLEEYSYSGKKYVRVKVNSHTNGNEVTLSNGEKYENGQYAWVVVEPIIWQKEPGKNLYVSKRLLYAGVRFDKEDGKYDGNFEKTEINTFHQNHFAKDIAPSTSLSADISNTDISSGEKAIETNRKTRLSTLNPDTTDPSKRRKLTYTETIKDWIDNGESVLLRGPSGIGKTERIKSLYPDLIYLKLTNNMFPEKVVGSFNLQTGQSIPPDFAKQAFMLCANDNEKNLLKENIQNIYDLADTIYERSKTSNKKIVILLDELLNVKPAVQSLVYTLVLNRLVEIGGGLKLPANTVIVGTGNQKKYSLVAEDLAEPLEKRFDHILDMEPKVGQWINEYAIPNKVHPAVIGYIFSKYNNSGKSESIPEMGYFYEEPEVGENNLDKYGCRGRTNDPRGWVSISNMLYSFEKNLKNGKYIGKDVESILKMSLSTKLRDTWAEEFYDFYNIPTLSVKTVVEKSYLETDLPQTIDERFACVTSLLLADESEVGVCREFIKEHCDPEYLEIYDITWIGNDEKRMEKINELQEMSLYSDDTPTIKSKGVVM